MSIELILAIFFFGLLPLIERAIRAARERDARGGAPQGPPPYPSPEDLADEEERSPYGAPPYETFPHEPLPYEVMPEPAPVVVVPARAVRVRASEMPIARATAHDRRTADAFDRPGERRRGRGGRVADILHTEAGLKRAFVLMTILGPCRAFSPYDGP